MLKKFYNTIFLLFFMFIYLVHYIIFFYLYEEIDGQLLLIADGIFKTR